jgi:ferredoxin-NADP reductase
VAWGSPPFIAIFRQLELQAQLAGNILLFANRTAGDIILKEELERLLGENYVNVLEHCTAPGMKNGFIGSKLLRQYATTDSAYYYICGSAKFTIIVIKHLLTLGIEKSRIIIEKQQPGHGFNSAMLNQPVQLN